MTVMARVQNPPSCRFEPLKNCEYIVYLPIHTACVYIYICIHTYIYIYIYVLPDSLLHVCLLILLQIIPSSLVSLSWYSQQIRSIHSFLSQNLILVFAHGCAFTTYIEAFVELRRIPLFWPDLHFAEAKQEKSEMVRSSFAICSSFTSYIARRVSAVWKILQRRIKYYWRRYHPKPPHPKRYYSAASP